MVAAMAHAGPAGLAAGVVTELGLGGIESMIMIIMIMIVIAVHVRMIESTSTSTRGRTMTQI